jgi:hypothetical protein
MRCEHQCANAEASLRHSAGFATSQWKSLTMLSKLIGKFSLTAMESKEGNLVGGRVFLHHEPKHHIEGTSAVLFAIGAKVKSRSAMRMGFHKH